MKQNHRSARPAGTPTLGIDASDLAEFPLALLSDTPPAGSPPLLEFANRDKRLRVAGDPQYGLPTARDMEVYIALLKQSKKHGFAGRIPFSRYRLLLELGWGTRAEEYARLTLALRRWAHTTFTAIRTIHDPKTEEYLEETVFRLLGSYRIYHRSQGAEGAAVEGTRGSCWLRWSETMEELLQAGYHHELDAALYLSLKSPIAQAEYRYLSARARDGKTLFRQHLKTFAQQHIGLRQPYVSQIQRKLVPAHEELIARGFLSGVRYEVMQGREHRGEVMVVFVFPGTGAQRSARRAGTRGQAAAAAGTGRAFCGRRGLVERLVAAGLARGVAAALAAEKREECERQLGYLPHRTGLKSRAGALRRAIAEGWPAPEGWQPARSRVPPDEGGRVMAPRARARREQEQEQEQEGCSRRGGGRWRRRSGRR